MLIVCNHHLFAHAEVLKDIAKYLIGSDFSCDVAEVIDAFAEILADEVA